MTSFRKGVLRVMSALVRNRHRLPRWTNRLIDSVAKNPDGLAGRIASRALGAHDLSSIPAATEVPQTAVRVYIGPTNYAGQAYRWARALEASGPGLAARNMAVELPGGFGFAADTTVPVAVYNASSAWQTSELNAVREFTHVLYEAERPLFGSLFDRDVSRELAALDSAGISSAFLAHGTDVRSPRLHVGRTPWSPFTEPSELQEHTQREVEANLELLSRENRPLFVSTPDLLFDLPSAHWCPVVVDAPRWQGGRPLLSAETLVVAHIPSMASMKGTEFVDPLLQALAGSGIVEYRRLHAIPAADMPHNIGDADVILDQFRVGSYGVAACEAMAAGRVVVGHILDEVRATVLETTGLELPIVEATPETLSAVLGELIEQPDRIQSVGLAGVDFVDAVHSGPFSANVLRAHWID